MKKVPKTDKVLMHTHTESDLTVTIQADPKRVKKALPKIVKTMKAEDRVMIIGVTKSPFGEF